MQQYYDSIDFQKCRRVDAALCLAIAERTGTAPAHQVCSLNPDSYTLVDLERAIELVDNFYPTN